MRYCYHCGKMTAGEPLYCGTCGRTYDVKLCPRQHVNPRGAEVCSKCGSRDLSTPQPPVPMSLRLVGILVRMGLGILLVYATLSLVIALINIPQIRQTCLAFALLLGGLWLLWAKLPDWFREAIWSLLKSRRHGDED